MGYDLYFANLTDDDHQELGRISEDALVGNDDDPGGAMYAVYDALRSTGVYERCGVHIMHTYCEELRAQGAGKLADALWGFQNLDPDIILDQLAGVAIIPTRPPDHEHVAPFETLVADHLGAHLGTARPDIASMDERKWALHWSRFLDFLVRAAVIGDGVEVA